MGFGVGLWNWPAWDLDALKRRVQISRS
jgi:hypothetical protein